jgi:hypothetical protein
MLATVQSLLPLANVGLYKKYVRYILEGRAGQGQDCLHGATYINICWYIHGVYIHNTVDL